MSGAFDDQPPEVRSLDGGRRDSLPPPSAAAERVREFLGWYGDGVVMDVGFAEDAGMRDPARCPTLYARDLEALCQYAPKRPTP